MKTKLPHCRNISKIQYKFVERGKIDATNRQIHDRSLSWLGTINNGGVKLVFLGLSLPSL